MSLQVIFTRASLPKLVPKLTPLWTRSATFDLKKQIASEQAPAPARKKTAIIPKITLIQDNNVTVTTLEEAQKLSKRRDLKLVKIVDLDTKTSRPTYKLMTGADYLVEDLKQRAERKANRAESFLKGEKLLTISHRISDHDLNSRIRNIEKWLAKSYEIRVVINGDTENISVAEAIYTKLEGKLKALGRFLQKRQKGGDIKFQILPPKRDKSSKVEDRGESKES